ncbi:hypothetical protein [Planomonospora venezuelensis]|uniref:Lipoprotein n=1 Tax=Planomonospora venezuelensis TaxID=1999 RepID=A0A841D2U4_PLAVE|nr:hypothetical protein [Planomonospora venezuelensis]MBB5963809.1 hypothetical protein [Planomonospora venezuelensis]
MKGTSKAARVLLAVVLVVGLGACSGKRKRLDDDVADAPAAVSDVSGGGESAGAAPEATTASPSESPASPVTGQVSLKGADSITVQEDDGTVHEAGLGPLTVVLDTQAGVCDTGELPHMCTVDQLKKALKSGVSLYAAVTIDGDRATRIEEIVRN